MRISIQGNLGSYSHIAAKHLFGQDLELLERDSFKEVFEDLNEDRCELIVIPIENSTYGSVFQSYDQLSKFNFEIIKEVYLKINFHLIVNPGTKFEDIIEIYTHPVGMGQIQSFLRENSKIKPIEFPDTAGSVKHIIENKKLSSAAAASKFAAEIYGGEILKENIHENKNNFTRFFALRKISEVRDQKLEEFIKPKTSLEFRLGEESGSLYHCLQPFAERDISLVKIESRPIINTHWEFTFYIDVRAGIYEPKMIEAMEELRKVVKDVRVLGCYEKGEYIET